MTELGQTDDPRALIPGDPAAVGNDASSLAIYGDLLHDAAAGLRRIDTADGWSGAAADNFRAAFRGHPDKWQRAGDAFHNAAAALDTYATTLSETQQRAADAIQLWNRARAATTNAQVQHAADVQRAQQNAAAQSANGIATIAPAIPFVDAGEPIRQEARRLLDTARGRLKAAGDAAGRVVGEARDKAPSAPSFWSKAGNFLGEIGQGAQNVGAHVVNGLASLGNSAVSHPGDMLAAAAGVALTAVSAGGEGLGVALDATGVGAIAGVPLNAVSLAGITAGAGLTTVAMADIARHAAGDNQVSPMNTDGGGSGGGGSLGPTGGPGEGTVTDDMIRDAMQDAPLRSQQKAVSLPRVQQFFDLIRGGTDLAPIRVDGDIIVEGNHRYIASRLAGQEPAQLDWPGGSPDRVVPWDQQQIDPASWGP